MSFVQWNLQPVNAALCKQFEQQTQLSPLLARILLSRGFTTVEDVHSLFEDTQGFSNPMDFIDMDKAVQRINLALQQGEKMIVFGDYDADGITACCMLYQHLQNMGGNVGYYIPERDGDGYGLNNAALEKIRQQGYSLVITVDNGISCVEEAEFAASIGLDLVITDHHQVGEALPRAVAVVDPHRKDCTSRADCKFLCGAGIAFKLICALEENDIDSVLDFYADIAAVGTVGDIVPLLGENRLLVKAGLEKLCQRQHPALAALMDASRVKPGNITASTLAFSLVPRINAAGRMGNAETALRLLLCEDEEEAGIIAGQLQEYNTQRKEQESRILQEAEAFLEADPTRKYQRVLLCAGENWHHGIIGIAAAKLMEKYKKPVVMLTIEGEQARGSARSFEPFSLYQAISACSSHLIKFGGHSQAAGLTLYTKDISAFNSALQEYARENFYQMPRKGLSIDTLVSPQELTFQNAEELKKLEPCGCKNPQPVLGMQGVKVEEVIPLSGGKHCKYRFSCGGGQFFAMAFSKPIEKNEYPAGSIVDMAFTLDTNEYMGQKSISLKIRDMQPRQYQRNLYQKSYYIYENLYRQEPVSRGNFEKAVPQKEDISRIYRFLKARGGYPWGIDLLYVELEKQKINYCKLRLALDVLIQLGFIQIHADGAIVLISDAPKKALENSMLFQTLSQYKNII